ncbi:MAG TPA: aminotransferase class I/II-fold pyridoxal phosphate-dependent enzyme [Pseudonocardiaceae bacterium]|nr:aminotransferase class I/II-fold pyridoxal phosphate-dependent enzyme [Pseudonocardiaceae bacterium]
MTSCTPAAGGSWWIPGVVQCPDPAGVVNLGPGYLDPALLPTDALRDAYASALTEYGPAALAYGENQGPLPLRTALADRITRADGVPCSPDQLVITAGTSSMLDLLARSAPDGAVVFVEDLSYDLGVEIFRARGLTVRRVPTDESGMAPDVLAHAIEHASTGRGRVAFMYLVPTFHNPTGRVVPQDRRSALIAVAQRYGVTVIEDDAYADVFLEPDAVPRSLAGSAGYQGVLRLGSFSKSLAPGVRLGWLAADSPTANAWADSAMFVSGGGVNHLAAMAVTTLIESGGYERHVGRLRDQLRQRRDALVDTLRGELDFPVPRPAGGFFVWLRPPDRCAESELVAAAERDGVPVAAGSRFGEARGPAVRLAFSFHPPDRLADAAARLSAAWRATLSGPPAAPTPGRLPSAGADRTA